MSALTIENKSTTVMNKLVILPIIGPSVKDQPASATIDLQTGQHIDIPKTGGEFKISPPISMNRHPYIEAKLYIYDRQPPGCSFTALSGSVYPDGDGVVTLKFTESHGPAMVFGLRQV